MHEVAVHHAGYHPVLRLFAVLLALVLRDAGGQVFDQKRIRILAELDRGAFKDAASAGDRGAKLQMRRQPTGKA